MSQIESIISSEDESTPNEVVESGNQLQLNGTNYRPLILTVGAVVAVVISLIPWNRVESNSPQWRHHQQATRRWDAFENGSAQPIDDSETTPAIKWVMPTGAAMFMDGLVLAASDVDPDVTHEIISCLRYNDKEGADLVWRNAQADQPELADALLATDLEDPVAVQPDLSYEQMRFLSSGAGRMIRLRVFDSCIEDGDIIEIGLNNQAVLTLLLTAEGSEICLPINMIDQGSNTLSIRPLWEGNSPGITVALETSQGIGYVKTLKEDDTPHLLEIKNPLLFIPTQ